MADSSPEPLLRYRDGAAAVEAARTASSAAGRDADAVGRRQLERRGRRLVLGRHLEVSGAAAAAAYLWRHNQRGQRLRS